MSERKVAEVIELFALFARTFAATVAVKVIYQHSDAWSLVASILISGAAFVVCSYPQPLVAWHWSARRVARLLLRIKRRDDHTGTLHPPRRATEFAAGYDLCSSVTAIVPARQHVLISTSWCMAIPNGHYGQVASRSGLAFKNGIVAFPGVIDQDYRGTVGVILFNHSDQDFKVDDGQRIAQLLVLPVAKPDVVLVDSLDDTARGSGGFGSTGTGTTSSSPSSGSSSSGSPVH